MKKRLRTWKTLIEQAVETMPVEFTLADIVVRKTAFEKHYPENRFIEAKIRQSLQVLRDQGVIRFLGQGRYERLNMKPIFSPLIDQTIATTYSNKTQFARVVLETWAELNLYCLHCVNDSLTRLPHNTPVADFECQCCEAQYQLKAKDGRFGSKLSGAAYAPTLKASKERSMPEHVLVEYDRRFSTVVFVDALPGSAITPERVVARARLSASARRAGWQGCTIRIDGIERVGIVRPSGLPREAVRAAWAQRMKMRAAD